MKPIIVQGEIVGSGIDYYKFVRDIPETDRKKIRENRDPNTFFYVRSKKNHYTQSGYKIVRHNGTRHEYYHREPSIKQLIAILRKEKKIK